MIIKFFEIHKLRLDKNKFFLFYGKNEALKAEAINKLTGNKNLNYDEKEILDNKENFIEDLLSNSLFDDQKIIVIKRATDKLFNIINEITNKKLGNTIIIINSENLEKKSKLRLLFEKDKKLICTAFYPDNEQTLLKITQKFLRDKNIPISFSNINLIVNKSNGDRQSLFNELKKVENFCKYKKKIQLSELEKLINSNENYSISELIDSCMLKDKKKTVYILNENNFSNEDTILITRMFLNKSKKMLELADEFEKNKNIELTISSARPPIFWKDKENVKLQILKWSPKKIRELIYKICELELLVKKNINNSVNLIINFIFEQIFLNTNN